MKNLVILGSSGSIGQNALWVAERFPEELKIYGLAVHANTGILATQIEKYHPCVVCVAESRAADKIAPLARGRKIELLTGDSGLEQLASIPENDIVLNGVVGFAGLRSTLAAARAGKRIALANKESMVAGGELVNKTVRNGGAEIIPVDSEHSAIFQSLKAGETKEVRRLILTSSGGPFRQLSEDKFSEVSVEQALRHPTWTMGPKITIDSATLMNKGLEIIEAAFLFGLSHQQIRVVIHPQSIVHSMVEFIDGSIIAQMSRPDMRLPIHYALFYPQRRNLDAANLGFEQSLSLEFSTPDENKFKSLRLARQALDMGVTAPAIFNAANEVAVVAFLAHRISFADIFNVVDYALNHAAIPQGASVDSIIEADNNGREAASQFIKMKGRK